MGWLERDVAAALATGDGADASAPSLLAVRIEIAVDLAHASGPVGDEAPPGTGGGDRERPLGEPLASRRARVCRSLEERARAGEQLFFSAVPGEAAVRLRAAARTILELGARPETGRIALERGADAHGQD